MITTPVIITNIPPHKPEAVVSIGREYITMAEY